MKKIFVIVLIISIILVIVGVFTFWNKHDGGSNQKQYIDSLLYVNSELINKIDSLREIKTKALVPIVENIIVRRKQLDNANKTSDKVKHDSIVVRLREYSNDSITAVYMLTADVKLKALQLDSCMIENNYLSSKTINYELQIVNYNKVVDSYKNEILQSEKKLKQAKWIRNIIGVSSIVLIVGVLL